MFLDDLAADWEQHGAEAIAECRRTDVAAYVRLAASLIPKEFGVRVATNPLEELTDEQLQNLIEALAVPAIEEHKLIEFEADQNFVPSLGTVS